MDDEIPDPLAILDQALAKLSTRAKILRSYYLDLTNEGFDPAQALAIVIATFPPAGSS